MAGGEGIVSDLQPQMSCHKNESFEFDDVSLHSTGRRKETHCSATNTSRSKKKMDAESLICVFTLFAVNLLNYMDRYTVAGVLTQIQQHFTINDAWAGFLQTVFIIFFMIFAPISGYLGDRYNRKWIMTGGLSIWVLAVLLSSFIPPGGFWLFVLLRGIVGIGEASYSTIAPTILADLFTSTQRSRVLMFFYFAIPVGSGLGYVVGSYVASMFGNWQWGIRVTPVLGVIAIACIAIFVKEPERGQAEKAVGHIAASNDEMTSYMDDMRYLCRVRSYLWSIVGYTTVVFVTGTLAWWAPTAINHAQAMEANLNNTNLLDAKTKEGVSLIFGAITCVGGLIGVSGGTLLATCWKKGKYCFKIRPSQRSDPLISAVGSFLAVPFLFLAFQLIHGEIVAAWISVFFAITFLCLNWAIVVDMLMDIVVPRRRSAANSWLILCSHLFGDASGPYIIGLISDWFRGSDDSPGAHFYSLKYAFIVPNLLLIMSGVAFLLCAWKLVDDIHNFQVEMGVAPKKVEVKGTRRVTTVGLDNNAFTQNC